MKEIYIKCKGKARVGKNTYTKEQVTAPDFTDDYGRLVPPGYVVFDFDAQPYIDKIYKIITESKLKCRMLKTTKGYHFMFRTSLSKVKDAIGTYNWIGLKCDIKACGVEETKQSYQSMRVNGVPREESLINTDNWEDIDFAPKWLYEVKKNDQIDLTQDQTGGRNNLFHSELMIRAKKHSFSYDEYVEMAHIINDYVLPEPIDEEELNTAIRPEEWEGLELGDDKQTILKMSEDLIEKLNCVNVENVGLSFYDKDLKRYSTNMQKVRRYLQNKYGSQSILISRMDEVIDQVNIIIQTDKRYQYKRNQEYILCDDELVSIWKDDIKSNTRTIFTDIYYPYKIMTKEEFDSFDGRAKSFMKEISCGDKEVERVIWECLGCMLAPTKPFGKIFIFYGNGANGKSLLLDIMAVIMGDLMTHSNILNVNDKFALEDVINGVCNVTDDVGITVLKETGLLKTLVNGSVISVERKFKSPIKWKPSSQFIMCCNEIPRIADTSKGMLRRLAFIPFNMQLRNEDIDVMLFNKIVDNPDNLRYLLTGAIFAYRDAIMRGHLTELPKQRELEEDFLAENQDPVQTFYNMITSECKDDAKAFARWIDGKTTEEVYSKYKKWCSEVGFTPITPQRFTRQFSKLLPAYIGKKVISLSGAKFNCYVINVPETK